MKLKKKSSEITNFFFCLHPDLFRLQQAKHFGYKRGKIFGRTKILNARFTCKIIGVRNLATARFSHGVLQIIIGAFFKKNSTNTVQI